METIFKTLAEPIITSGQTPDPPKKKSPKKKEPSKRGRKAKIQQPADLDEETFWKIINKLEWRNKDEIIMNIPNTKNKLATELGTISINKFNEYFDNYMHTLQSALGIRKLTDNKKRFLSHIVALGHDFYRMALDDPSICGFIEDSELYQNFYEVFY